MRGFRRGTAAAPLLPAPSGRWYGDSMPRAADRFPSDGIRLTYEDYLQLPDDRNRYEILDGELAVTPAPAPEHQMVSRNLEWILHRYVTEHRLGQVLNAPIDVILGRTAVVQPDLLFLAAGRESLITERAIEGPPDLIVEIVSPSSADRDREAKAKLYARFGVRHYWIVDPEARTMDLYRLSGRGYRVVSRHRGGAKARPELFPGLEVDLSNVWA